MRAVIIERQDDTVAPNVRSVSDWPEPTPPGVGEARVRVHASALNHLDLWVGRGVPGLTLEYPRISGSDMCGTVEAVGECVDEAWVGKRVILNAATDADEPYHPDEPSRTTLAPAYRLIGEHTHGTLAEIINAPACNLAQIRDDADVVSAAAFALTHLTAYSMLVTKANIRAGQIVLCTGIGGGVALAALSIARQRSCRIAVTSRHEWKLDRAKELGADLCVTDTGQDWSREIREWTNGRGVDVAVDSIGKLAHMRCLKSLARGGTYVTPGCTTGPDATTDLARIFWNQLRILGSTMGTNDELREITGHFNSGAIKPVIDSQYAWDNAADAFARLESGEQFGKIVITW